MCDGPALSFARAIYETTRVSYPPGLPSDNGLGLNETNRSPGDITAVQDVRERAQAMRRICTQTWSVLPTFPLNFRGTHGARAPIVQTQGTRKNPGLEQWTGPTRGYIY